MAKKRKCDTDDCNKEATMYIQFPEDKIGNKILPPMKLYMCSQECIDLLNYINGKNYAGVPIK